MIPLNSYFQSFGYELAQHSVIDSLDFSDVWQFANLNVNIEKLKSDYKRAYRLAHETVFKIGFIFLDIKNIPTCSYISTCNQSDRTWVSFIIVRYDVTADEMESITMQAITDCHSKMPRHNRR